MQPDCHQRGFIVLFPTDIAADLVIFGQYKVIRKSGFDSVLSIHAWLRSLEVYWTSYVCMVHRFFGYNFDTGEVSKLHRIGSEGFVSVPEHEFERMYELA